MHTVRASYHQLSVVLKMRLKTSYSNTFVYLTDCKLCHILQKSIHHKSVEVMNIQVIYCDRPYQICCIYVCVNVYIINKKKRQDKTSISANRDEDIRQEEGEDSDNRNGHSNCTNRRLN